MLISKIKICKINSSLNFKEVLSNCFVKQYCYFCAMINYLIARLTTKIYIFEEFVMILLVYYLLFGSVDIFLKGE